MQVLYCTILCAYDIMSCINSSYHNYSKGDNEMNVETLEQIIKNDDQGLLNVEGIKYGVYYQGSYWTGGSPAQALVRLFQAFPRYRITKEIWVRQVNYHAGTNCVSACYQSKGFLYNVEELRRLRAKTRKQVA